MRAPLALVLLVLLVPAASASIDVNRVTLLFHDLGSATLQTEILYYGDDARSTRATLDADRDGTITRAETDAMRATLLAGSDPMARVSLDGSFVATSIRATDATFRDAEGPAASSEALLITMSYEQTWPTGSSAGRTVTVDTGDRQFLAVHFEAPPGHVWTEATGVGASAITDGGATLSGLRRFGEDFRAVLGPGTPAPSVDDEDDGAGFHDAQDPGAVPPADNGAPSADALGTAPTSANDTPAPGVAAALGALAAVALALRRR